MTRAWLLWVAVAAGCGDTTWENVEDRSSGAFGDPSWIDERALRRSIELAADHIVRQQLPSGLFHYQYDVVAGKESREDNVVRQLGTYWSLGLLLSSPEARLSPESRRRVTEAFDRMTSWLRERRRPYAPLAGAAWIDLGRDVQTGAVALCALGLIERVKAGDRSQEPLLREVLAYLAESKRADGGFGDTYQPRHGRFARTSNPYADGEVLLALAMSRHELGWQTHAAVLDRAAPALRDKWFGSRDDAKRKGFYQWGTMAFWHYAQTLGGRARREWEDTVLSYADWMVLEHETLGRRRNTSYAVEGLATAFAVARARRDRVREKGLRYTILKTHARLISAQIGHPLDRKNRFVQSIPRARRESDRARGGFLNGHDDRTLRIDVTQHAIHAMLLTLEHGVLPSAR